MSLIERAVGKLHSGQSRESFVNLPDIRILKDANPQIPDALDPRAPSRGVGPSDAAPEARVEVESPPRQGAQPLEISLERLSRQGFIAPNAESGRTLSEFRMIKRPLLMNVSGGRDSALPNARRIMVTSALPGEGKTFCTINLALSIADERDHSVLLVDADVARPSIPKTLGIKNHAGLMDALIDPSIDPTDLVMPTSINKLLLLTAGQQHGKATEFLASSSMTRLLQRLSSRFPDHIIVFDSPPLLATTEASVLAAHMGQIVLVVEAGKTDRGAVAAAVASLEGAPGQVSTLMNKAPARTKSEFLPYGGYGYGYEARS